MSVNSTWQKFNVGSSHPVRVKLEHIQDSDPCDKTNCMLTRSVIAYLLSMYGETFKVRSTNHGLTLDFKGRRITFVFDTSTAKKIYNYDRVFKKTRSRKMAWETVGTGFKAKLMVEANTAIPVFPPMSEEIKEKLAQSKIAKRAKRKGSRIPPHPTRDAKARHLSL